MAVHITLAVDCDQNESVAQEIEERFNGLTVAIPRLTEELEDIPCNAGVFRSGWNDPVRRGLQDWVLVSITPKEIYLGGERSEMVSVENLMIIRNTWYGALSGQDGSPPISGYRSAQFGVEAQDRLGDRDWIDDLEEIVRTSDLSIYDQGLILDETLVKSEVLREKLSPFSPGYLWYDHQLYWPFRD